VVKYQIRKQSETAHLRQGHVVRQVAAPYSVWQRFPLCPIESNVNENFKVIQNPGFLPDHPQNWITGGFCYSRHSQKISERSVHNFLSYLADTHTDKQTKSGKTLPLAEVINSLILKSFFKFFSVRNCGHLALMLDANRVLLAMRYRVCLNTADLHRSAGMADFVVCKLRLCKL